MAGNKDSDKKPRPRIKKVRGHGGHHGGAWKVAYADFVTAMMALFLVLWLVSQADVKLKQSIANYFRSPGVFSSMEGGVLSGPRTVSKDPSSLTSKDDEQALVSVAQNLKKKFQDRPQFASLKDRVRVDITKEGLKIQIIDKAEKVSFASGSAQLTQEAQTILTEISNNICELPNHITIGGHTDKAVFPAGSTYTNWELSTDRANAARRSLESACVKPEQIRSVVGYADTELLIPQNPYASSNRRISITVLRLLTDETEGETSEEETETKGEEEIVEKVPSKSLRGKPSSEETKETLSEETDEPKPKEKSKKETTSKTLDEDSDEEIEQQKNKLSKRGSVTIGEPDQIPRKVKRTKEPAHHKKVSEEN